MFSRRALITIIVLVLISPLFGVIGAELVGYHEPLDVAAEVLGLEEKELYWSPFPDYTVPGLPEDWFGLSVGYIVSGFIGVLIILGIGFALRYVARRR